MIDLKSYGKQEDAALDAAWLGSNGIEATIVDESGYGGNFLAGTMPGTIRLQVHEDQEEQAREILAEKSMAAPSGRVEADTPVSADHSNLEQQVFRVTVGVEGCISVAFWLFPTGFIAKLPDDVEAHLTSLIPSKTIWEHSFDLYGANCLLSILAYLLIWFFIRAGRVLFVITLFTWTLLSLFMPQAILTSFGSIVNAISTLLSGTILAQMYLGSVAARFRRTLQPPAAT